MCGRQSCLLRPYRLESAVFTFVHSGIAPARERAQIDSLDLLDDVLELVREQFDVVVVRRNFHDGVQQTGRIALHVGLGAASRVSWWFP
jgi:hypothetical protein